MYLHNQRAIQSHDLFHTIEIRYPRQFYHSDKVKRMVKSSAVDKVKKCVY
uniref:Uncharacterized protein n=1 Tax=Rhizophora mucronata TaxID=61149 RepID=A0A2P2LXU7_RHIMU